MKLKWRGKYLKYMIKGYEPIRKACVKTVVLERRLLRVYFQIVFQTLNPPSENY